MKRPGLLAIGVIIAAVALFMVLAPDEDEPLRPPAGRPTGEGAEIWPER